MYGTLKYQQLTPQTGVGTNFPIAESWRYSQFESNPTHPIHLRQHDVQESHRSSGDTGLALRRTHIHDDHTWSTRIPAGHTTVLTKTRETKH